MKVLKILLVLAVIAAAGAGGWYFGRSTSPQSAPAAHGRKILYYQSPMHPWIKSDRPGNCTICGMKLTPVYEGEKGIETAAGIVSLSSNAINVVHVQTEEAQVRSLERTLVVAGRIETEETRYRVISAWVDGRIEKLFVNYTGAEVEAGQPLALIYSPALLTAEREYLTIAAQTNLNASPQLASEHERLVEAARQRLRRLGLTDSQIADLPSRGPGSFTTQIVAPIGGTVVTRAAWEGQYVKEGDKLFEIADLSKMWFRFEVYEQDLPFIHPGDTVRVSGPALNGRTLEGPIAFIDPNINDATRAARVRVELDNPLGEHSRRLLKNGLFASGQITLRTLPVLSVPRTALVDPGDQPRVYVDRGGGAYEQRLVQVGERGSDFVQILSGLAPGEKVVTSGNLLLDSQAQINHGGALAAHAHESHPAAPSAPQSGIPARQHTESGPVRAGSPTPEQSESVQKYLNAFDKLAAALAADDLPGFNRERAGVTGAASSLAGVFKEGSPEWNTAQRIASGAKLAEANDLAAARASFLPLSLATADLTRTVRRLGADLQARIYKCPMYPESGSNAFWVQIKPPLRNPFFGSEMLDCGVEVK